MLNNFTLIRTEERLKISSRKFQALTTCFLTLKNANSMIKRASIKIRPATAKPPTKTHSLKIRTDRSIKTLQVSLIRTRIIVSSKVTPKLPSVTKTGVSTRSTATLHPLKILAIRASVVSTRTQNRDTILNRSNWRGRPSSSGENMSITRRCGSSKKNIGRVSHRISSSGDRALDIRTHLIRHLNSGWETSAWTRFRRSTSRLGSWDFCFCTWLSCLCGKCSSGLAKEKISRWIIVSKCCYMRDNIEWD